MSYADYEKQKEHAREYYKKNKKRVIERQKAYYRKNKERIYETKKKYIKKNIERVREYRRNYWRKYKQEQGEKTFARAVLHSAIKKGDIVRPDKCQGCKEGGLIEAHHPDYMEPLEVKWLCRICHVKEDKIIIY